MFLFRAFDKLDNTVDFLLTRERNRDCVNWFLIGAIGNNFFGRVISIDKNDSNALAINLCNKPSLSKIKILQCEYFKNIA